MMALSCLFIMACETTDYGLNFTVPTAPEVEGIIGPNEVDAGSTETYSVEAPRQGSTYAWVVQGASSSSLEGTSISVTFDDAGETSASVAVTETNSSGTGDAKTLAVTVTTSKPVASTELAGGLPIKDGSSDTVKIAFDKPIATAPSIDVASGGGSFGAVAAVDATSFYAIYTHAGGGNGTIKYNVFGAVATAENGGETMDTTSFENITIDNIAPVGQMKVNGEITGSVQPGATTLLSLTFENNEDPLVDTAIVVVTISGTNIVTVTDTMTSTNATNTNFELFYTPELDGASDVTSPMNITVDNANDVFDLAGNVASVTLATLVVDNVAPTLTSTSATSSDAGIMIVSGTLDEAGMIKYLVKTSASDSVEVTSSNFIESFSAGENATVQFLETDTYNVYFLPEDVAGNQGDIVKQENVDVD